jgi:hypothetical protein
MIAALDVPLQLGWVEIHFAQLPVCISRRTSRYRGWNGSEPTPPAVQQNGKSFQFAMKAGVPICMGGDVGVFAQGQNAREI